MASHNSIFKTKKEYIEAVRIANEYTVRYAADLYGVNVRTIRKWKDKYGHEVNLPNIKDDFEIQDYATGLEPIGELIENRVKKFNLKKKSYSDKNLINVKIKLDGPIGIAHFGDPHIDDDGTDKELLYNHADIINETEG